MNDAIEDGVGVGGIADAVALFENLEQVVRRGGVERLETPVVEHEQLHTAERPLDAGIAGIAAGEREVGEQLGNALVEDRTIVAAGFVAER
jgi:hypothetical protein